MVGFKVNKPRLQADAVEGFAAKAEIGSAGATKPGTVTDTSPASRPPDTISPVVQQKPAAVRAGREGADNPEVVFNLRILKSDRDRLEKLAKNEDRSMQYIAKRIFKEGLDEAETGN